MVVDDGEQEKKIVWSKQRINNRNYLYSPIVKSLGADRIEDTERIDKSGNFVVQYACSKEHREEMVLIAHKDFTMTFQNAWNHAFKYCKSNFEKYSKPGLVEPGFRYRGRGASGSVDKIF